MNIFLLDYDIERCAEYHCDQHVVKMIVESIQMLCTALNKKGFETPYTSIHKNHPCVLWLGYSFDNFLWLKDLILLLNDEYLLRFDKQRDHHSLDVLQSISKYRYTHGGLTPFPQVMPKKYQVIGDAVAAYRRFYIAENQSFARWTEHNEPEWFVRWASETPNLTDDNFNLIPTNHSINFNNCNEITS